MRQKNVIWVAALAVGTVIAAIAVFALVRHGLYINHHDGHMEHREHNEMQQHHQSQTDMTEQGHHYEGNSSDHHEHSPDTVPSGVLQDNERVIKVKARQFEFDPNRITVKKGEKVRLEITSQDVTHGINIEGYGINRELKPDKTEIITFTADKTGRFHFHCSVYCGEGHSDMHGELIVIEKN